MKSFKSLYRRVSKYLSKKKDYTPGSTDMITMLRANNARNEESATSISGSNWAPGALKRHDKQVKQQVKLQKKLERSMTPEVDKMLSRRSK